MTAFTDISDPELQYSHCWQVKTRVFNWDLDILINYVKTYVLGFIGDMYNLFGESLVLKLSFSTEDPPKNIQHSCNLVSTPSKNINVVGMAIWVVEFSNGGGGGG